MPRRTSAFSRRRAGRAAADTQRSPHTWLGDRLSPAPEVIADFVRSNVHVIVAYGSPATLSAKKATKSIPIVMVGGRDPVVHRTLWPSHKNDSARSDQGNDHRLR